MSDEMTPVDAATILQREVVLPAFIDRLAELGHAVETTPQLEAAVKIASVLDAVESRRRQGEGDSRAQDMEKAASLASRLAQRAGLNPALVQVDPEEELVKSAGVALSQHPVLRQAALQSALATAAVQSHLASQG